jgi:hypothetical protein
MTASAAVLVPLPPVGAAEQPVVVVVVVVEAGAAPFDSSVSLADGSGVGSGRQISRSPLGVQTSSTSHAVSSVHGVRHTRETQRFEEQSTFSEHDWPLTLPGGVPSSRGANPESLKARLTRAVLFARCV